jgi:hypothetical protein
MKDATLCTNCNKLHNLQAIGAGTEREILRLCAPCFDLSVYFITYDVGLLHEVKLRAKTIHEALELFYEKYDCIEVTEIKRI